MRRIAAMIKRRLTIDHLCFCPGNEDVGAVTDHPIGKMPALRFNDERADLSIDRGETFEASAGGQVVHFRTEVTAA